MRITAIHEVVAGDYEGYLIETDTKSVKVLIDNVQRSSEVFGFTTSEDEPSCMVGARVYAITLSDIELPDLRLADLVYPSHRQLVTFETDRGPFQIALYCSEHSHDVKAIVGTEILVNRSL